MTVDPLVSIIIPAYNCEKSIKYCIDSILQSTYQNIEIIVIIDGSTDSTEKVLKQYDNELKVKVYMQYNQGVSSARNKGLNISRGDYIMFVDCDDFIHPQMVEIMLSNMIYNKADLLQCDYKLTSSYDENIDFISSREPPLLKKYTAFEFRKKVCSSEKKFLFVWNKMYSKRIISENYFRVSAAEDFVFIMDVTKNIDFVFEIELPLYYYFQNIFSISHGEIGVWHINVCQSMIDYFDELILYDRHMANIEMAATIKQILILRYQSIYNPIVYNTINNKIRLFVKKNITHFFNERYIPLIDKIFLLIFTYFPNTYVIYRKIRFGE